MTEQPRVTPAAAGPPAGRYGAPRGGRRDPRLVALVVVVAAALVGWVAWAAFGSGGPSVSGQVTGFDVRGPHRIEVDLLVTGSPGAVVCRLQAQGADHGVVGVTSARLHLPRDGRSGRTFTVRTRDTAVTAVVEACDRASR